MNLHDMLHLAPLLVICNVIGNALWDVCFHPYLMRKRGTDATAE